MSAKPVYESGLVITGYRLFCDYEKFKILIKPESKVTYIIAGDCKGTDALAKKFAKEEGIKFKEFHADWKTLGKKKAGPIRNVTMLKWAKENCKTVKLIAFLASASKGTANCIESADKLGIGKVVHAVSNAGTLFHPRAKRKEVTSATDDAPPAGKRQKTLSNEKGK